MAGEVIRRAVKEDEEAIRLLVFSVLAEYGFEPSPKMIDADLYDLAAFYAGGAFDVLIDEGGCIIGCVGLKREEASVCELRKMYLDPRRRGKGLGKKLLKHAVASAKEMGFRRIELETASVLEEAIELYRKFGFSPVEHEVVTARCDLMMALDL